jgi:hypothetical protein
LAEEPGGITLQVTVGQQYLDILTALVRTVISAVSLKGAFLQIPCDFSIPHHFVVQK